MVKKESLSIGQVMEHLDDIVSLLTEEQKHELRHNVSIRRYKKNEMIYREGEVPQYLLCLISGKVKIYKDGVGGRTQIIRVIKPVGYFAYRAYFAGQNFITSAAAFETSTLALIPLQMLQHWISENIELSQFFIRQLSIDLGLADERTVSLTQKHIRGRLAEALLFLIDNYGLEEDEATLSIYLSREDLANLSNMTTSNAIRTLSAFASERLIATDGRKIMILDFERLHRVSNYG